MFLLALALGILIGWLRGGSLSGVARLPVRWVVLLPIPFLIRSALRHPLAANVELLSEWAFLWQGVAYGLLVVLAVVNRHLPGSTYLMAGTAANALVIMLNGGQMPVSEWAIRVAAGGAEQVVAVTLLRTGNSLTHEVLGPETRLPWLADIIPLPRPFPFPSVASAGDVVIALGLLWLIITAMGPRPRHAAPEGAVAHQPDEEPRVAHHE